MMRIELRGLAADDALAKYAELRILSWNAHLGRGLTTVTVCFANETGRGGSRTRCRVLARPVRWANVVVEETDVDPYAAVDRSAERLANVLAQLSQARPIQRGAA